MRDGDTFDVKGRRYLVAPVDDDLLERLILAAGAVEDDEDSDDDRDTGDDEPGVDDEGEISINDLPQDQNYGEL
jgi:hypothetical protein